MTSQPNNKIINEMRILNELRRLNTEQRNEVFKILEEEQKQEDEALQKNPNLHVERKLEQVINELKDVKTELYLLKERSRINESIAVYKQQNQPCQQHHQHHQHHQRELELETEMAECPLFSWDWDWIIWVFFFFVFVSLLSAPVKSPRPLSL